MLESRLIFSQHQGHKIFYDSLQEIDFSTDYVKNKYVKTKKPVLKTLPVRKGVKMYAKPRVWAHY